MRHRRLRRARAAAAGAHRPRAGAHAPPRPRRRVLALVRDPAGAHRHAAAPPSEHHRPGSARQPAVPGRPAVARDQRRALQLPRGARGPRARGRRVPHELRHRGARGRAGDTAAGTRWRAARACGRSPPTTSARGALGLCRDRFGEKPLFVHRDGDALYFASEPKFLFALPRPHARAQPRARSGASSSTATRASSRPARRSSRGSSAWTPARCWRWRATAPRARGATGRLRRSASAT